MTTSTPDSQPETSTEGIKTPPQRLLGIVVAIGPGIVVIGSIMGSGELINAPLQAAKFGFVLLWAVILSCVIKYFLQIEIGRHALAHDRTDRRVRMGNFSAICLVLSVIVIIACVVISQLT